MPSSVPSLRILAIVGDGDVENNTCALLPTTLPVPQTSQRTQSTTGTPFSPPSHPQPVHSLYLCAFTVHRSPSLKQNTTPQVKLLGKAAQQSFPSTATFGTRFASSTPLSTQNINHLFVSPTVNLQPFPNINHTQPSNNNHHQLHHSLLFSSHKHNTHICTHTPSSTTPAALATSLMAFKGLSLAPSHMLNIAQTHRTLNIRLAEAQKEEEEGRVP